MRALETQIALLQQQMQRHMTDTNDHRTSVQNKLDAIDSKIDAQIDMLTKLANDYYGDEQSGRIGVAKMARRAYHVVLWMLGGAAVGGTGTAAAVNLDVIKGFLQ